MAKPVIKPIDPFRSGWLEADVPEAHKHPMPTKFTVEDAAERLEELVDRSVAGEEIWIVAPCGMTFWLKPLVAPDGSPLPQSSVADSARHGTSPPRDR